MMSIVAAEVIFFSGFDASESKKSRRKVLEQLNV